MRISDFIKIKWTYLDRNPHTSKVFLQKGNFFSEVIFSNVYNYLSCPCYDAFLNYIFHLHLYYRLQLDFIHWNRQGACQVSHFVKLCGINTSLACICHLQGTTEASNVHHKMLHCIWDYHLLVKGVKNILPYSYYTSLWITASKDCSQQFRVVLLTLCGGLTGFFSWVRALINAYRLNVVCKRLHHTENSQCRNANMNLNLKCGASHCQYHAN